MSYNPQVSSYTIDNDNIEKTDSDFLIKKQLYEQYKQSKKNGFKGTYEEYLSVRDFT